MLYLLTMWSENGLPADLQIRIPLDAGPYYSCVEAVTPLGHIFAKETLSAVGNIVDISGFKFMYTGKVLLPKGHSIFPAYHLFTKASL